MFPQVTGTSHLGAEQHAALAAKMHRVVRNRELLARTLRAVESVLDRHGELHITQKDGAPYDGWRVDGSARWLRQLRAADGSC